MSVPEFDVVKFVSSLRLIRLYHKTLGGHTHIRVFAGKGTGSFGNCGTLVMTNEEWETFKKVIDIGQSSGGPIEFVQD